MNETFILDNFLKEKREELQKIVDDINTGLELTKGVKFEEESDVGEVFANLKLALRHVEDAKMRLGKVYQAIDGGKSIYNK